MPVIECDAAAARERLEAAGLEPQPGNTDHERWRVEAKDATAVAYDGKVVIDLRECRLRAREALAVFDEWSLTHVPREVNEHADALANEALDEGSR